MSRRGDNIRKRKDGRWEGRYIFSRDTCGKAIYRSVYGRTYAEVKKRLIEESNCIKPDNTAGHDITVNMIAENWLQNIKMYKKYATYVKYNYIYNSHIKQNLGEKKLKNISADDCRTLIESEYSRSCKNNEQLSKSTINSICNVLSQIMEYGDNPVSVSYNECKIYSMYKNSNQTFVFSKEEQQRLQDFLFNDMDSYKLGIYVCMLTGLRLGEICALKTNNIDLSRQVLCVTETVQRIKSENPGNKTELLVTNPKTVNSNREIPICDILLSVLKKYMPFKDYLVNGNKIMEPRTYQYYLCRILKKLSIEGRNFHSLRHTFATNCIDCGMDPKCLSEILGHSDVKTTLNRYVHPSLEYKMRQLNSFASDYGQISGQI